MPRHNPTDALSTDDHRLAAMLRALGNPIRFQIMQTLAERQTCITQQIVETTPLAQSTVSQHLKVLREAGLIRGEVEGPATCYCLDADGIRWLKEQIGRWLPACCPPVDAPMAVEIPLAPRAMPAAPPRKPQGWSVDED